MKFKAVLLASAIAFAAPMAASAEELDFSFNVGAASDYMFRGISQTDNNPEVFAGADIGYGNFYAGTWVSNVDFNTEANTEWDVYVGYKRSLGMFSFDIGALAYTYPEESDLNTIEYKAAIALNLPHDVVLGLNYFYSPEFGKNGPETNYTEVAISAPIPGANIGPFKLGIAGAYGTYDQDTLGTYDNYKVAVNASTESGWFVEAAYTDTDIVNLDTADGRGSVTLRKTF